MKALNDISSGDFVEVSVDGVRRSPSMFTTVRGWPETLAKWVTEVDARNNRADIAVCDARKGEPVLLWSSFNSGVRL